MVACACCMCLPLCVFLCLPVLGILAIMYVGGQTVLPGVLLLQAPILYVPSLGACAFLSDPMQAPVLTTEQYLPFSLHCLNSPFPLLLFVRVVTTVPSIPSVQLPVGRRRLNWVTLPTISPSCHGASTSTSCLFLLTQRAVTRRTFSCSPISLAQVWGGTSHPLPSPPPSYLRDWNCFFVPLWRRQRRW